MNRVGAEKKTKTPRKKAFRIDFDESHDFNKLFSKAKVYTRYLSLLKVCLMRSDGGILVFVVVPLGINSVIKDND